MDLRRGMSGALAGLPFLFFVYGPVLALVAQLPSQQAQGLWLPSARRMGLLLDSVAAAAAVALLAMALSAAAAFLARRGPGAAALWVRAWAFALIFVPAYIHAYGWSPVFSAGRAMWGTSSIFSSLAAVWVQAMSLLPLGVLLASLAWDTVDRWLVDAARVSRRPGTVWRRVVLAHSRPVLAAAGGLLFVLALLDYSVPSLFGVATYSMEVFTQFGAGLPAPQVLVIAFPLLAVASAALLLSQGRLREVALGSGGGGAFLPPGRLEFAMLLPAALVLAAQAAVAIGSLFSTPGAIGSVAGAWAAGRAEILRTSSLGLVTAAAALLLAYPVAQSMSASGRRSRAWWAAAILPLAIPGSLTGIGSIALWNRPGLAGVYDSPAILAAVWLSRYLPLAALLLAAFLSRRDRLMLDAALVFAPPWRRWRLVELPSSRAGLAAAAAVVYALSTSDIAASLVVAPPGRATLSMRAYNYLHAGARETVAGFCIIQLLAAIACAVLILAFAVREDRA